MKIPLSFTHARAAARSADEKLGQNIVLLDVRGQTALADCFVFVGATSHLHVRALEDAVREGLKKEGATLLRTDGQRGHLWRVLDYGHIMIHIMDQKMREFYGVERLWEMAKKITFAPTKPKKTVRKKAAPKKKIVKKRK